MKPEDIERLIDYLIKTLGPAGEQLLNAAIRHSYVLAIADAVFMLAFLVAAFLLYRVKTNPDEDADIEESAQKFLKIVGVSVLVVLALFELVIVLERLLTPEYAALYDLVRLIGD